MRRMRGVRQKHGTKLTKPMSRKNMQNWASRMNRTSCPMGEFSIC